MAMTTELNMAEGFNPADYARTITDADGQQSQYLDVQHRKMWFRLHKPNGKIVKKICSFDGNRHLESAETAAVGRALADAGFGLQFCLERDPTPVDMGQQFFGQPDKELTTTF